MTTFWRLQLAGWGVFYVAMSFSRMGRYPLSYMLVEKLPLTVLGLAASLVLRRVLRPRLERHDPLRMIVAVCVVSSYLLTMAWTALFNVAALWITEAMLDQSYRLDSVGALLSGTVYHAFALVAWGFLYIGIKHHAAWQAERENALRAQALAAEARLGALQAQLNPHFFFNSLNAVSTLVVEGRNDDASAMIARLGDFLRATFARHGAQRVGLADELEFVQRYLEIERVRFEDRLKVSLDVEEQAYDAQVPFLILQPLVENAVRHGIARLPEGGAIRIHAAVADGILRILVENDAPASSGVREGVGLSNVRERLRLTYGDRHQIAAEARSNGTFRATIGVPFEKGAA